MSKRYPGVTTLGEGKYRIRCEVRHPKTDRVHEIDRVIEARSAKHAASLLESARADWRSQHSSAVGLVARVRLGEAMTAWLATKKGTIAASTHSNYSTAAAWWDERLGDYYLDAVEPTDVRASLVSAYEARVDGRRVTSTDTINGRLRVLHTFAKESRCLRIVEGVEAFPRNVREVEADEDEGRGLDVTEFRRLLDAIAVHAPRGRKGSGALWRPLLTLMAWTGMRFGEASALEWKDLDLDAGTVRIRRAQWRGIIGHPKARASKREIPLVDDVLDVLRDHRRAAQREQSAIEPTGIMFVSTESKHGYVSNTGLRKNMLMVCGRAAGETDAKKVAAAGEKWLEERPTLHCLRHTLNNIVRKSTTELVRQAIIGHADEEIGARYSKVDVSEKRAAMAEVRALVKGGA